MANEITVTAGLKATKGSQVFKYDTINLQRDLTGTKKFSNTQVLSTTEEQLIVSADITTPGYAIFRNLSSTVGQIITIGVKPSSTFYPLVKLLPGDVAVLRLDAVSVFAKAAAGTPELDYTILEE